MNILLDTNISLDHLLDRTPFSHAAAQIFASVEMGEHHAYICATTVTTIDYLTVKQLGKNRGKAIFEELLNLFEVAPVNRLVLESALHSKFTDFEDSVIHAAALHCNLDAIVTRNQADFKKSKIPTYSSEEFLIL